ncbi:MAG TPA: sensor histidine kinase [Thermoanaerobaculia bacterium]|jgi:signal transduction histidine kinase|nr:sensor histidine kinase [Thermoanaerobaculia bacterium]
MEPLYSPHNRAERLIAAGRVALATSSLFAVWFDPSEPANYAAVAYALLALYVVYAVVIAALVWHSDAPAGRQRLITHAFDFVFFSLFVYFTAGPASPFTTYFVFSMICATLRWQWRGALWTAVASLATFLALGLYFAEGLRDPAFAPTPFIVRGVYLVVVAVLLGYLGAHEQRTRREMAALAAWPHSAPLALEATLGDLLKHTAQTFDAPRVALAWFEPEEPWLCLASWCDGRLILDREPPTSFEPLVPEPLARASFLCSDVRSKVPIALARTADGFRRFRGQTLHPDLRERLIAHSVLSLLLRGETFEGRLFVLDKAAMTSDDLLLGEVVGERVGARLDLFYLTQRLRETAATEERIRLARDLHDGVLQSLTGVGLRLEALRRQVAVRDADPSLPKQPPTDAEKGLADLQRLVALEQRDLRFFIRELSPRSEADDDAGFDLATRIADLRQRLEIEWDLAVELRTEGLDGALSPPLAREIYHLVREALVNAVRHGQASSVRLEVEVREGQPVRVGVADNGRGFPFTGRYSGPELADQNLGPRSLRERVAALQGTLELESNEAGARLDIRLPIPEAA